MRAGEPVALSGASSSAHGPVTKALNKDKGQRHQAVADLVVELRALQSGSDAATVTAPTKADVPSIAWEVGHVIESRRQMLSFLGAEIERSFSIDFATSSATDGQDYPTVVELQQVWNQLRAALSAALESSTENSVRLAIPPGGPHGKKSVLNTVVFLVWHEACHMGAIGAIRKSLGLPGPAELVMASQSAPPTG